MALTGASPTWSCAPADVPSAVADARVVNGDTINVSAGAATWSSQIKTSKAISIIGAGQSATTGTRITLSWSTSNYDEGQIHITQHATLNFRFSNMRLSNSGLYEFFVGGAYNRTGFVRLDNLTTSPGGAGFLRSQGLASILVDQSTFGLTGAQELMHIFGDNDASWGRAANLGSPYMTVVEDCAFTGTGLENSCLHSFEGARWCFRRNTVNHAIVDSHPGWLWSHEYGGRQWEIYQNTWSNPNYGCHIEMKAGTGVIWGNTGAGNIRFHGPNAEIYEGSWGCCSKSNLLGTYCGQRVGMGAGFVLDPVYVWSNTGMPTDVFTGYGSECGSQDGSDIVREGTEYILATKSGYTPLGTHPMRSAGTPPTGTPVLSVR